jgi:hypothetical protein
MHPGRRPKSRPLHHHLQIVLGNSSDRAGFIIMKWLDSYFSDEDDPPVIDFDRLKTRAQRLEQYCTRNPGIGLITAAEPIMESK